MAGERLPRRLENVYAECALGRGYKTLEVRVDADARARNPGSKKVTLVGPAAKRHLRHVTPGAGAAGCLEMYG